MADPVRGTAPVTDLRPSPRGVLPRGTQTWLMAGVALGVLAIIVFSGRPEPPPRAVEPSASAPAPPNPDRLRDYQDRLRVLNERARQQAVTDPQAPPPRAAMYSEPAVSPPVDPLDADRKRREYESLFSSNVVMSRRPDGQRLTTERQGAVRGVQSGPSEDGVPPSIDEVANAVVRATARYGQPLASATSPEGSAAVPQVIPPGSSLVGKPRPASTGPITSTGPLHRILEGTVIDTVLTNRLEGSAAAPVNCLVTTPIYSHGGEYVLIPAGSRVLGETKPIQTFGETRLAVAFYRLVLPDGRTYRLEQFTGLNDIGDAGLRDQVNQHYRSTFGASAAIGLITGFAQYLGSLGLNRGNGDRTVVITGNIGDATAQSASQTMNRFLNRLPNVTIREGHRVKVYLTNDLDLPAFEVRGRPVQRVLASNR